MNKAIPEVEARIAKRFSNGFVYELVINNAEDSAVINNFIGKLSAELKKIDKISSSRQKDIYEVYLIGSAGELEKKVYEAAGMIPELEGLRLIMQRGNSLTFDTGL